MSKVNPFQATMQCMRFPEGKSVISVAGHQLEADEFGLTDVPNEFVTELTAHGLIPCDREEEEADGPLPPAEPAVRKSRRK